MENSGEQLMLMKGRLLNSISTGNPIIDTLIAALIVYLMSSLSFEWVWKSWEWFRKRFSNSNRNTATLKLSHTLAKENGWEPDPHTKQNMKLIYALNYYISLQTIPCDNIDLKLDNNSTNYRLDDIRTDKGIDKIIKIPTKRFKIPETSIEVLYSEEKSPESISREYELYYNIPDEFDKFLEKILESYSKFNQEKSKTLHIYTQNGPTEVNQYPFSRKSIDSIFFPEKEKLLNLLVKFNSNPEVLPRFTLLLHGEPGNGKSSLIRALATMTERNIQYVKLSTLETLDEAIMTLFSTSYYNRDDEVYIHLPLNKRIIVFEDIDAECLEILQSREEDKEELVTKCDIQSTSSGRMETKSKKEKKLNLSDILNLLDGIFNQSGTFFVITTNHPEKLDKALLRPGRITFNLELKSPTLPDCLKIIQKFFPDFIPDETFKLPAGISAATIENSCQLSGDPKEVLKMIQDSSCESQEKESSSSDEEN